MHQQSRHPPRIASPAVNPQANPLRTNNPRKTMEPPGTTLSGSEASTEESTSSEGPRTGLGPPTRDSIKKLDQIVQNFFTKAAALVVQSRIPEPLGRRKAEVKRPNKWFSIDTDELDDYRDELLAWKISGSFEARPPPMIIEVYLDASNLPSKQNLVHVDDNGKRRNVLDALNALSSSLLSDGSDDDRARRRMTEIALERWRIELKSHPLDEVMDDFGSHLPTIYKRMIIFFRSLFTATHIMPCWKLAQQLASKTGHPELALRCRFMTAEPEHASCDPLRLPLFDGRDFAAEYMFGDIEVPSGRFNASVVYRNDCNFKVDDSDADLGPRLMGVEENFFKPSIQPTRRDRSDSFDDIGSFTAQRPGSTSQPEPLQTYGSLSTFHGAGALATSPISALKAMKAPGSDTSSPPESMPASVEPDPPHSLPIRGFTSGARASLRNYESGRPSISFQPFKAGSVSGSPRTADIDPSPSRPQIGLSGLHQPRNRSSLTQGMAASLRGPSMPPTDNPPPLGSPKPTSRYSSSFTHRRGRLSFGGQSRGGDDDQGSSGKQSLSSSAQPGSGLLAEGGASSGSFQTDDDNISDFLKVLESKKTLASFDTSSKKGECSSAAKKTAAQLSKFQMMRDSNNALTDSMTSSMHLQRSSSTSSRQLTNVPGMINAASMSTSSSPGKPLSPHTPHTPAIPSRLSENSIIDYHGHSAGQTAHEGGLARHGGGEISRGGETIGAMEEEHEDENRNVTQQEGGAGASAIPIPLSPRVRQAHAVGTASGNRRASSVAQRRDIVDDDDDLARRSISLDADVRESSAPTLRALLGMQRARALQPAADMRTALPRAREREGSEESVRSQFDSSGSGGVGGARTRYQERPSQHHSYPTKCPTPPTSSRGLFSSSGGSRFGGGGSLTRGSGGAAGEDGTDDEPLLFAMSELERAGEQRSLDEGRASLERYEPRGHSNRGW